LAIGEHLRMSPAVEGRTLDVAWTNVRRAMRVERGRSSGGPVTFGWPMKWATVAASLLLLLGLGLSGLRWLNTGGVALAALDDSTVEWIYTDMEEGSPVVYEDPETGCTVIWMMDGTEGETHAGT